jgi:hypothetical protein
MNDLHITLGEERVISMAPADVQGWGPWQFPTVHQSADGTLYLSFHNAADSVASYGAEPCRYRSQDHGLTWQPASTGGGLPMPDGTMIRPAQQTSWPIQGLNLPGHVVDCAYCHTKKVSLYDLAAMPEEHTKWYRHVVKDDTERLEEIQVRAPGYLMRVSKNLLVRPFFYIGTFYRRDPQTLMAVSYHPLHDGGQTTTYYNALFFESRDDGRSFELISTLRYRPPYEAVPDSEHAQGWLEPSLCFLDERTAFTLLRTSCIKGVSPLYIAWSHDGCRTWSDPVFFDDIGVWPQAIRLPTGVVLAGYGRPGLYVRAFRGDTWTGRTTVVTPGTLTKDTCSYCALTPLADNRALIVYSRFDVKDSEGRNRKAILCRDVSVC